MISIIVAASANNVIGAGGELPWRLPDDLRRFKRLTMHKPIVMGRRTWESIGRPLPGRQNIVLTRRPDYEAPGCQVVTSPAEALRIAAGAAEVMIIGGSEIYALFLPKASRIYLTHVVADIDGDTYFPRIEQQDWRLVECEAHPADENNEFALEFRVYERKGRS
jgi:dihydrofolate reductase